MKKSQIIKAMLFLVLPLFANAQIGVGTQSADPSSILDLTSTSKGILTPRMTTVKRDSIDNPAKGLLIYNTTSSDFNYYDLGWNDFSKIQKSVVGLSEEFTKSGVNVRIPGMKVSPDTGTYLVSFNSQFTNSIIKTIQVNTMDLNADLVNIYNQLINVPITNAAHPNLFGILLGETLTPGKYEVGSAMSVQMNLILDGGGDQSAVFIFHADGDITLSSYTSIILKNGAKAENVFWVAEGAVNVGEHSTMKGTLFSHGFAVAVGSLCTVEGRMFSTAGAVAFGPGGVSLPANLPDTIDLKSLSNFVVYTTAGAINNTGTTTVYNGDLGSDAGATGSLAAAIVNGIIYGTGVTTTVFSSGVSLVVTYVTFSIYKNGVEVPGSSRRLTCDSDFGTVLLQSLVTVTTGDSIEVMWKTETGLVAVSSRSLILTKVKS
ncbi:Ice-binding protein [Flavobacteriaceae bacterium]